MTSIWSIGDINPTRDQISKDSSIVRKEPLRVIVTKKKLTKKNNTSEW